MNEHIKELISLAQKEIWVSNAYNGSPEFDGYELDAEKLAKLIVRYCSAFVYNYPEKYLTRNQALEICLGMEKHFGVEE